MAQAVRFGKPCMTNLPGELGRKIIGEIMSAVPPDDLELREESQKLMEKLKKAETEKNDERDTGE